MSYKKTHSDLYAPDESYSTHLLDRIKSNGDWVYQNRGAHTSLVFQAFNNDETQEGNERPYVSVSGYSAFLRIPWYVDPALTKLNFRVFCRVSNGEIDANPEGANLIDDHVHLSAKLLGDPGNFANAHTTVSPFRADSNSPAEWGWVRMSYDVDPNALNRGSYDKLLLAFKSPTRPVGHNFGDGSSSDDGLVTVTGIATGATRTAHRVKADTDDFYAEGGTSGAPQSGANEITATALTYTNTATDRYVREWVDHVRRQESVNDRAMYIWPITELAGPEGDTGEQPVTAISKWHVPYIQFRSVEIWGEYA